MSAVPCDFKTEQEKWISSSHFRGEGGTRPTPWQRDSQPAQKESGSPWWAPNELWLQLLLLPNWRMTPDKAVGACKKTLETTHFQEFQTRTLAQTTATRQPPLIAHRSRAVDVAKSNGKLRLLHVLCPVWTMVKSIWFNTYAKEQKARHWEHGFFQHKRREEAVMVCEFAGAEAHSTPCMVPPTPSRPPRARRTPTQYTATLH